MANNPDGNGAPARAGLKGARAREETERKLQELRTRAMCRQQPQAKASTMQPLVEAPAAGDASAQEPVRQEARDAAAEGRRMRSPESLEADLWNAEKRNRELTAEAVSLRSRVRELEGLARGLAAQTGERDERIRTLERENRALNEINGQARARMRELEGLAAGGAAQADDSEALRSRIRELEGQLDVAKARVRFLESDNDATHNNMRSLQNTIQDKNGMIMGLEGERDELKRRIAELEAAPGTRAGNGAQAGAAMQAAADEPAGDIAWDGFERQVREIEARAAEMGPVDEAWLLNPAREGSQDVLHERGILFNWKIRVTPSMQAALRDLGNMRRLDSGNSKVLCALPGCVIRKMEGERCESLANLPPRDERGVVEINGIEFAIWYGDGTHDAIHLGLKGDGQQEEHLIVKRDYGLGIREFAKRIPELVERAREGDVPDGVAPPDADDIREPLSDGLSPGRRGPGDFNPEGNPEGGFGGMM